MLQKTTPKQPSEARGETDVSVARERLLRLFDEGTFVETNACVRRADGTAPVGVITGYGAVDGALVYAFAQDPGRMLGAIDEHHAKKIENLYHLALSNGAPVVGIFDSCGAALSDGVGALAAYGRILSCVTEASGAVPQIALLAGPCIGTMATVAALFDFVLATDHAEFYVSSPLFTDAPSAQADLLSFGGEEDRCFAYLKRLLAFLPAVCDGERIEETSSDDPNRLIDASFCEGNAKERLSLLADAGSLITVGADEQAALTAFAMIGGVRCGIVATDPRKNAGRLSRTDARRIARFVDFCDAFDLPLVTLVDSEGVEVSGENETAFAADLARIARSYADADIPLITLLCGKAIGAAYVLLGSKAVGADLVYATPDAEIAPLAADAAVAFAENGSVTSPAVRAELEAQWRAEHSSSLLAASGGEVDDIIECAEVRARVASALYMMRGEGPVAKRRGVGPL